MISKRQYLKKSQLYLITNENIEAAKESLQAGSDILQLRIKEKDDEFFLRRALHLRKITKKFKKILIINDRIDIVLLVDADGVHLGQKDIPVKEARKLLGPKKIIGKSTHSVEEAMNAVNEGADYIGIGPAFSTKTKIHYKPLKINTIKKIIAHINIPYFIIGGINLRNIQSLLQYDITRVAIFSSIIKNRNPHLQTKKFLEKLTNENDINRKS